jgi:Phage minor capsid protein 2.
MIFDYDGIVVDDSISSIYMDIEYDLITNIAKNFSIGQELAYTDQWRLDKLLELHELNQRNSKMFTQREKEVNAGLEKTLNEFSFKIVEKDVKKLGGTVDFGDENAIRNIVNRQVSSFKLDKNLTKISALESANQSFLSIVNKTYIETAISTKTPQEALRAGVKALGQQGIKTLTYSSATGGVSTISLQSGLKRAVNTTLTTTMKEVQFAKLDEWEMDLIETSSHMGARPKCEPYQGKIFTRRGKGTKQYPSFEADTSYGLPDGILGINCTHMIYPFLEGVSQQTYQPYDKALNDKAYKESQIQRHLEREIRKTKMEVHALQTAGFDASSELTKLKDKQSNIRNFVKETGRTRIYSNEQIHT